MAKLTEQAYLVLLALAQEPRHGYGIMQAVKHISDGRVVLSAGTLYGVIDRLSSAGQIAAGDEVVVDGRLRRYYSLTDTGRGAADAETARLEALTRRAATALRPRLSFGGAM